MEYATSGTTTLNKFRWPNNTDELPYPDEDILCAIDAPVPINQRGHYSLSTNDFEKSVKCFQLYNKAE